MGTLEGDERRSGSYSDQKSPNVDSSDDETQEFDSQYSPGGVSECDGTNDNLNIANTVAFDDTYQLEDASETHMVNLAAETQVVDLYEESQKADLYEETQKADLYEETQMVDLYEETQMVDLYEESQKADLYEETQMVDLCEESQKANLYEETQMVDLYGETQIVDLPGETQVLDKFDAELDDVNEHGQTNKADIMCETQILSEDEDDSAKLDGGGLVGVESTVDKDSPKKESPFRGFTAIRTASIRAAGLAARARSSHDLPTTSSDKSSLEEQSTELECEHKSKSATKSDQEFLKNGYSDISERKPRSTAVRKLFGEDQDAEADESETEKNQIDDNSVDMFACENSLAGLSYANSQEPGDLSQARALEVVDKFLDLGFLEDDEGFGKRAQNVEKSKIVSAAKGSRDLAKKSTLQNTVGECDIYDWDDAREDDGGGEFFLKKKELFFENEGRKQKCLSEPRKSNSKKEKRNGKTRLGNLVQSDVGLLNKARSKSKTLRFGEEALQKNLVKNFDEQLDEVSGAELIDNEADKGIPDISNIGPDTQMAAEAMGDLCFEVHMDDCNNSGDKGISITRKDDSVGVTTRQAKRTKRINTSDKSGPSLSPSQCRITKKRENGVAEKRSLAAANVPTNHETEIIDRRSENCCMEDQLDFSIPVARRTLKSRNLNCSKVDANSANSVNARSEINDQMTGRAYRRRNGARDKNAVTMTIEKIRKVGLSRLKQSSKTCAAPPRQETLAGTQHSERLKMSTEVAAATPIIPNNDHSNHSLPTVNGRNARKGDAKSYDKTPVQGAKSNGAKASSTWATPTTTLTTLGYDVSPICMGDEYQKQSCRKNLSTLSLLREIDSLHAGSPEAYSGMRESRKRKDITTIKVLFSQHLDEDVVNKQKKILTRLGGAVASTMVDATHFVADEFVRTRNMLEAIACGKPVVTSLWIESCGQASCLIDEKNYILRDAKKEKEFGFCLPVSLARACQQPLLKGQKVFITPNTKPGKEILTNLVKAVHGMTIERLGRSAFKDEKIPDDLLILSCEEDYDACIPFLEKGGAIYSSELLLNGIVKQKLEYQRHCLFADQVKRTRSTVWLKKRNKFLPVIK